MIGGLSLPNNIHVTFAPGAHDLPSQSLSAWILRAQRAIVAYFGRFPVPSLDLHIGFAPGRSGVRHGRTWGEKRAVIHIEVGEHATQAELDDDWMLVHEMVHLALPSLGEDQHWLEEGSATYVEPIARELIGNLGAKRVWSDMVRDMPQGLPEPDSTGLDHTDTWAATYWGGALFCLMADVEIRRRTQARQGLQQALRGVLDAGGNILSEWPVHRVLKTADQAVGVDILESLYDRMGLHRMTVDLPQLWKDLGVDPADEHAPLAYVRHNITPTQTNSVG